MLVIDKNTATDMAREIARLLSAQGIELKHAATMDALSASLGFHDINAMTAHLRKRPLLLSTMVVDAPISHPENPLQVVEQAARLLRHVRQAKPHRVRLDGDDDAWPVNRLVCQRSNMSPVVVWADGEGKPMWKLPASHEATECIGLPHDPLDIVDLFQAADAFAGLRVSQVRFQAGPEVVVRQGVIEFTYEDAELRERQSSPKVEPDVMFRPREAGSAFALRTGMGSAKALGRAWEEAFLSQVVRGLPRNSQQGWEYDLVALLAPRWMGTRWTPHQAGVAESAYADMALFDEKSDVSMARKQRHWTMGVRTLLLEMLERVSFARAVGGLRLNGPEGLNGGLFEPFQNKWRLHPSTGSITVSGYCGMRVPKPPHTRKGGKGGIVRAVLESSVEALTGLHFDGSQMLRIMTEDGLCAAAAAGWTVGHSGEEFDLPIDYVSGFPDVCEAFDRLEVKQVPFTIRLNPEDSLKWLALHRPGAKDAVLRVVERMSGNASDWKADEGEDYELADIRPGR
jgi:hypothetical protein